MKEEGREEEEEEEREGENMSAGKSVKHYEGFFEETLSGFSRLASCNGQGGRCYNGGR